MKRVIIASIGLLVSLGVYSQPSLPEIGLAVGQSFKVLHSDDNQTGFYGAVSLDHHTAAKWLSYSGRVGYNAISQQIPGTGGFEELSIGTNLDLEINASYKFRRFRPSVSLGPSLRYGREKHIFLMFRRGDQVLDYRYFDNRALDLGYSYGANIEYQLLDSLSIGCRYGTNAYFNDNSGRHQNGFGSVALVVKVSH